MVTRIGLDFDGVLADTPGFVVGIVREEYGVNLTREDFEWADGRPTIDADLDAEIDAGGSFEEFVATPEYVAVLDPVPGAREALWRLAEASDVKLQLATHRPPAVHDAIEQWFDDNDLPEIANPGPPIRRPAPRRYSTCSSTTTTGTSTTPRATASSAST